MVNPSDSVLPGLPGFHPYNLQPWTVEVVVSVTVLALASVGLRLVSRRINSQKLWWDDWMILFSMTWNLAVVGFIFAMYSCGMGIHADLVDPADIVMMAKWLVVAEILYAFNLGWTKLSLLLMYYRIFRFPFFKRMAWGVGAFVMTWVVVITFLFIFICVPVEKLWYPQIPGRCINQVGTWIANAASTILTDLIILILPIPQVWNLRLRKAEKIGLTFAFSLGFFVVFASAYRTSVLFTYTNADPTYTLAPTVGWTAIEMSAGIVSTCLPTMRPVLRLALRTIGLRTENTALGSASSKGGPNSKGDASRKSGSRLSVDGHRARNNDFHRLGDETDSGIHETPPATPLAHQLRPDAKGFTVTTVSNDIDKEAGFGDEIPLQGIRVQTQFRRSTNEGFGS